MCRQLGTKHNTLTQRPPTTLNTGNLQHDKHRSEFARHSYPKHRSHLPMRKKTTKMKLQKLPRDTLRNSVECPKSTHPSFSYAQSRNGDVQKSTIYRPNQNYPGNANSRQLHQPPTKHQSATRKLCKCREYSKILHNRNANKAERHPANAITSDSTFFLINRIPAHKIIFDFPVTVLLLLLAL